MVRERQRQCGLKVDWPKTEKVKAKEQKSQKAKENLNRAWCPKLARPKAKGNED